MVFVSKDGESGPVSRNGSRVRVHFIGYVKGTNEFLNVFCTTDEDSEGFVCLKVMHFLKC